MNSREVLRYNIFKVFFKQYNTILSLSRSNEYLFMPQSSYIDIKSINILIRSMHEMYLVYTYLCSSKSFSNVEEQEEIEFKFLAYQYSGENDNVKNSELLKKIKHDNVYQVEAEIKTIERRDMVWSKILKHKVYDSLSKGAKRNLKKGNWKLNDEGILSWADLVEYTPLNKAFGVFEYHNMSLYAHSTYSSIQLEANHDGDVDGLLCHCYILAVFFSISVLNSFNKNISVDCSISKRELALVYEFYNLGSMNEMIEISQT